MTPSNGGAVASECPESAEAAISILNAGGNAVDAAVAATAVQGVTRPYSGGIGGGGLMHVYLAKEKRFLVLDHRSVSSQSFGEESFIDPDTENVYPASVRVSSTMSTAVPGAVKAWEEALEKYGTMSLHDLLQPAIEVAEQGFIVSDNFVRETAENAARFNLYESTRALYLDENGNPPKPGTRIKNPDFAKTYKLIAKHGSKVFYEGEIAEAIVDTVNNPPVRKTPDFNAVDLEWKPKFGILKGRMNLEDLKNYETITTKPTKMNYRGYDIYGAPPVSSGGITIGEALNILEGYDLSSMPRAQALHYYLEACRYVYADRSAYIGDPKFTKVPVEGLLSKRYAAERRKKIKEQATAGKVSHGNPWPHETVESQEGDQVSESNKADKVNDDEGKQPGRSTIHLSVTDQEGNIVSYTTTIISFGGSGIVVPGYGFLLNNALAGLIPTQDRRNPNYPRARMRPLSSMAPTIVMKDETPVMTLGTPGSETILTTILQTIIHYVDFGMNLPEAIAAPRLCQMNPEDGKTKYEEIFLKEYEGILDTLVEKGQQFKPEKQMQGIGTTTGIEVLADGRVRAAAEPIRRGGGHARVQFPSKEMGVPYTAE